MIPLDLEEIARATGGRTVGGATTVTEVTTDSRAVPSGALFVALRGERFDGNDFIEAAMDAGAGGYLAERAVGTHPGVIVADSLRGLYDLARIVRDRTDPTVIALTGSVGKTTVKDLTAAAVGAERRVVSATGSYNNEVGVPLTCLAADRETEALIVEIGARGVGHIAALTPLVRPDIAIVTAVAAAHLEMFGDIDTVAVAKGELVEALEPDGTAVLNADDPRVAAMAARTTATVLTYGVESGEGVDVSASGVRLDRLARARFTARTPWGEADVELPIAGGHHVGNALAAIGVAGVVGVELAAAAAALENARVSSWRSEVSEAGGVVLLNDAYNANPTSMRAALSTLAAIDRTGETWAVLGVMAELGTGAEEAHAEIGRVCAKLAIDHLVAVGEEGEQIAAGADDAGLADVAVVTDAAAALDLVAGRVQAGDAVLVKASRVAGLEQVADGLVRVIRDRTEAGDRR